MTRRTREDTRVRVDQPTAAVRCTKFTRLVAKALVRPGTVARLARQASDLVEGTRVHAGISIEDPHAA